MAANKHPFPRIRLVIQRSSLLTKAVVLTTLVVCTAMLLTLTIGIRAARNAEEKNREAAAALEQENSMLEDKINSVGSVAGDKQIAQDELGLVDPNAVVFTPEN